MAQTGPVRHLKPYRDAQHESAPRSRGGRDRSRGCGMRVLRDAGAARHAPAPLRPGDGSEKAGPEVCGGYHHRGTGWGTGSVPNAAEAAAARDGGKHPVPAQPELLPQCPAGGVPTEPRYRQRLPGLRLSSDSGCRRAWHWFSIFAEGCGGISLPSATLGKASNPVLTSMSPRGGEDLERGSSARVHAGASPQLC